MSQLEEIPLQPHSSQTGASKTAKGKGGACCGIKDFIIDRRPDRHHCLVDEDHITIIRYYVLLYM